MLSHTNTDTVGTGFSAEGAKAVIADVDSTPASVAAALDAISTGTLTGQVPGLSLINASVVAQDAVTAYGETAAQANPTLAGAEDGVLDSGEADDALTAATDARFDATTGVSPQTTRQLQADAGDAADDLAATKTAVEAVTGGAAAVKAYEAAFAKDAAATAALTAAEPATAAAEAGLDKAVIAVGTTVTLDTLSTAAGVTPAFADAAAITAFLGDTDNVGTPAVGKLIAELNKVPTFGAGVVEAGAKTLAANTAAEDLVDTSGDLALIEVNGAANTYIADKALVTSTAELVKDAQEADAAIAIAKAVVDQYGVLNKAVSDANEAITKFASDNSTKVSIQDIAGAPAADANKALSDVFYFKHLLPLVMILLSLTSLRATRLF